MAEPTVAMSPASGRLLAAEEGHIGVYSGDEVMMLDPPVGKHLRELHLGQAHRPLPRHQETSLPSRIYSGDAWFGHEGVPLHLGAINTSWYDPLGRGAEVRYSPYHPQYILPLPFALRQYTSYANDPMIHLQPNAMGHGHYANAPPPFHGPHATEYDNPNGDRESPAYQHAHLYDPMSSNAAAVGPSQESTKHSAGGTVTHLEVISESSDLPAGDTTDTSRT